MLAPAQNYSLHDAGLDYYFPYPRAPLGPVHEWGRHTCMYNIPLPSLHCVYDNDITFCKNL